MSAAMFHRFVVDEVDPDSGRRMGLFQIAYRLERENLWTANDRQAFIDLEHWFSDHLQTPATFALGKKPHAKGRAVSWFRATARTHLDQAWRLARLVGRYRSDVTTIRTERPGYVVFQDDAQVIAYPFADTPV